MILRIIEIAALIYASLVCIEAVMLAWASRHAPILDETPRCPDFVPEHWGIRER